MTQLASLEADLIQVALTKMFQPTGYFDYCTITRICDLAGVIPPKRTLETLHLIHCVHWNEMPEGARLAVFNTVLGLFQHTGFDLSALQQRLAPTPAQCAAVEITTPTAAVYKSFFKRLLP